MRVIGSVAAAVWLCGSSVSCVALTTFWAVDRSTQNAAQRSLSPKCIDTQVSEDMSSPLPYRPLGQQEVVDLLNVVPTFGVVSRTEQLVPLPGATGEMSIMFYLDIADAQAALKELRDANPRSGLQLSTVPLGTVYALSEWETDDSEWAPMGNNDYSEDDSAEGTEDGDEDDVDRAEEEAAQQALLNRLSGEGEEPPSITPDSSSTAEVTKAVAKTEAALARGRGTSSPPFRIVASELEVKNAGRALEDTPAPALLKRRNKEQGIVPLFGSEAIRFELPSESLEAGVQHSRLPLFFSRRELSSAWLSSGGSGKQLPTVQVTDLRTLVWQLQTDTTTDWRSLLFVASQAAIEFVQEQQSGGRAESDVEEVELTKADVAGLVFGEEAEPQDEY